MRKILLSGAVALLLFGQNVSAARQTLEKTEPNPNDTRMKTCSQPFLFDKESEWEQTGDKGVVRKILGYNGQIMMVKIKFEQGAEGSAHSHYHTQVTYVASGKFEFTIDGERKVVSAGDALYMEPDVKHGCKCLEAGMLIDCFSPMRETFLPKK